MLAHSRKVLALSWSIGMLSVGMMAFSGCSKSGNQGAPAGGAKTSEKQAPRILVVPTPGPSGVMKCPDGSDAVKVAGKCKGAWHVRAQKGPNGTTHTCEFEWATPPASCKAEGYQDSGRESCYGPPYQASATAGTTESECAAKHGTPPNNEHFEFYCCK